METTMRRGKCTPVAGTIEGMKRTGKGEIQFSVCGTTFSLPEKSTFAKMIKGVKRTIVVYEMLDSVKFPRVITVIPNYTVQQVLQVNTKYPAD
jgi:hypothetical protein